MIESSSSDDDEVDQLCAEPVVRRPSICMASAALLAQLAPDQSLNRSSSTLEVGTAALQPPGSTDRGGQPTEATLPDNLAVSISVPIASRNNSFSSTHMISPTPSLQSEKASSDSEFKFLLEQQRRQRLQLYVFVLRCIAYPFNAKQPNDLPKRMAKVTVAQLQQIQARFQSFFREEAEAVTDDDFRGTVLCFSDLVLNSDRLNNLVSSGACTLNDLNQVFRCMAEKRIRSMTKVDSLRKEAVLTSWMTKFACIVKVSTEEDQRKRYRRYLHTDSSNLTKDQLYDTVQLVLGVKKFEHQILQNALQLDVVDEQAAAIRRELDGRHQKVMEIEKGCQPMPEFTKDGMESAYIEEQKLEISNLMANLESLPVSKVTVDSKYSLQKLKKSNATRKRNTIIRAQPSMSRSDCDSIDSEAALTKDDVTLTYSIELVIIEVRGLASLVVNKKVYCTMEVEGSQKLQTGLADSSKPMWDTQGDFTTTHSLPLVKVKLYAESASVLSFDDKEIAKLQLHPTPFTNKSPEWHTMTIPKQNQQPNITVNLACRMDKPPNMKHGGYLYALGKVGWRKWKRRYFVLVQVSQYTFAMCSYRDKKSEPVEMVQLDGYTVDYIEPTSAQLMVGMDLDGGKYFFNAVRDGDGILFSSEDEADVHLWVMAMYRATGQNHRPSPPPYGHGSGEVFSKFHGDTDRAKKHGMEKFIDADPCESDHNSLLHELQCLVIDYRLKEHLASLGWLSPGLLFVIDEYCARYGVRSSYRHLNWLAALLDRSDDGCFIDPVLLHYCFSVCDSHVIGNRNETTSVVLQDEEEQYFKVKCRLLQLLKKFLSNFRMSFPFGRPEGALKASLTLLEALLQKEAVTRQCQDESRLVVGQCLENAACNSYTKLTTDNLDDGDAAVKDEITGEMYIPVARKLDQLTSLAEMCVELTNQNNTYYAEAFAWYSDLFVEHTETFWCLFAADMDAILFELPADSWDAFQLFQILNNFFSTDENMNNGRFHQHLQKAFAPMIVRYVDLMESSIGQSLQKGFDKERWEIKGNGCCTSEELFWKLEALQLFIYDLNWPDREFSCHLNHRLQRISIEMVENLVERTHQMFLLFLRKSFGLSSTDYIVPTELCTMINVTLDSRAQALKMFKTANSVNIAKLEELIEHSLSDMVSRLVTKLLSVLDKILAKLARYDDGSLIGSIFSFTYKQNVSGSGKEVAQTYIVFVRNCLNQVRQKVIDELWILYFFEVWYVQQVERFHSWLSERSENTLHPYQVAALTHMSKKIYSDFELQGVTGDKLKIELYESISRRIQFEETTSSMVDGARKSEQDSFDIVGKMSSDAEKPVSRQSSSSNNDIHMASKVATATTSVVEKVGDKVGGALSGVSKGLFELSNKMGRTSINPF